MDSKKEIYDNLSKNAYDNGRIDKTFEEDSKLEETQVWYDNCNRVLLK